jgi:uncharacterized metal-binding protein
MALLLATYALISGPALAADSTETKAKQIWQLLDYVAVDYGVIFRRRLHQSTRHEACWIRLRQRQFRTPINDKTLAQHS